MGIPCSHIIGRRITRVVDSERALTINDFLKQWWIGEIAQPRIIINVVALEDNIAEGGEMVQQERARLIALAEARINQASPAQLVVVDDQTSRPIHYIFNPTVARGKGRPTGALGRRTVPLSTQ